MGHAGRHLGIAEERQSCRKLIGVDRPEQPEHIEGILVANPILGAGPLGDLVDLGHQKSTRTGHPDLRLSAVR